MAEIKPMALIESMKKKVCEQTFRAQKNDPDGAKTMKAYYWKICGAEYDQSHA